MLIGLKLEFDITKIPSRNIQRAIDVQLGTTEYLVFVGRKATNAITVHLASLEGVKKICMITRITLNPEEFVPFQAYSASGPNTQRCIVYGLSREDSSESVVRELPYGVGGPSNRE